jgi:hypothetical protein
LIRWWPFVTNEGEKLGYRLSAIGLGPPKADG